MKRKSLFLCSTLCLSSCAVSPTLRAQNSGFVYVMNKPTSAQQPASILGYSIRDNTGELTAVPGSPFQMSLGADTLAVTSSGRFLYTPSAIPGVQDGWASPDTRLTPTLALLHLFRVRLSMPERACSGPLGQSWIPSASSFTS